MAFSLGNGIWNGVFAVPNAVTDQHLKIASGLSVKVLLLLLRHGGQVDPVELGAMLAQSPADIQDALNYWVQCGVIREEGASGEDAQPVAQPAQPVLRYVEVPQTRQAAVQPEPARGQEPEGEGPTGERKVVTVSRGRRRMTTAEIGEMAREDKNIEYLLQEAQSALNKTLTPVSTDTVIALYSYYEMQPDTILMLIKYCASIGKDSMNYIEKVASDWIERGIATHEQAEAEILRLTHRDSVEGKVKSAFGIYDRSLIAREKKYIQAWTDQYGMDLQLISLAYERCVETKGKLSFSYINGILSNWHGKGIKTTAQAMQEIQQGRKGPKAEEAGGKASYDMDELENMITFGDIM